MITPLFLVLLVIDSTDLVFAIDSVPAIFGITNDPFIVFTSNIFAILGLRALYFLLAGVMDLFRYLNYGLSARAGLRGRERWWPNSASFSAARSSDSAGLAGRDPWRYWRIAIIASIVTRPDAAMGTNDAGA